MIWKGKFLRRRPRGPRRKDLLKQDRYWLRAGEVPRAWVDVDPGCAAQFDRFIAFHNQNFGVRVPVELDVLLRRDGPGKVSVWTAPSERVEAIFVGHVSGAAVSDYEGVLGRLARDQAPVAIFTARQVAPGRYDAVVEGRPPDWAIPQT
jgi:hypothetical protein